jgi:hypothetical protein
MAVCDNFVLMSDSGAEIIAERLVLGRISGTHADCAS